LELPVAVIKGLPEGSAIVGAFDSAAQLFRRIGVIISASNSDGDNFTKNFVIVLAEQRSTTAIYSPVAFCICPGLTV